MGDIYWSCCLNATSLSPLATAKALGLDIPPTMLALFRSRQCLNVFARIAQGTEHTAIRQRDRDMEARDQDINDSP